MTQHFKSAPVWKAGVAALAALAALSTTALAAATNPTAPAIMHIAAGEERSLYLGVGRSTIVDLAEDAQEIFVGDPSIANAIVRSARRLYITTVSAGNTTIFALGPNNRKIAVLQISVQEPTVTHDLSELEVLLKATIPHAEVHAKMVGASIILTGEVDSAEDAQKAIDLSNGFLSQGSVYSKSSTATSGSGNVSSNPLSGGAGPILASGNGASSSSATSFKTTNVINSLIIRGLDQVSLRVTISEIRRDIVKQLGVTYTGTGSNGLTSLGINNSYAINGLETNTATIGWSVAGESLSATLAAFEQQGVARTLAEPTVTAVSGERAKFLAGGTIPIVSGASNQNGVFTENIVQQPYGVTLNFTPVVLSQGRVQLRVATEVTDIDRSTSMPIAGTDASTPGFRTRRNETTVELPSGGSIVTAGLLSTQASQAIVGVPGLMNLPVLGSLFRSRDYQREETELLIIVTPYIVHAVDPKQVVRPDQNFAEASDPQAWLLGRVNRIYSASGGLRPMPNYSGKVGFITD